MTYKQKGVKGIFPFVDLRFRVMTGLNIPPQKRSNNIELCAD